MLKLKSLLLISVLLSLTPSSGWSFQATAAPIAKKIPFTDNFHQDTRVDNYRWMHEANDPAVKAHLDAENVFAESYHLKNQALSSQLISEYKNLRTDLYRRIHRVTAQFIYFRTKSRTDTHWMWYRKDKTTQQTELIFDENTFAKGRAYFETLTFEISPSNKRILLIGDLKGRFLGTPIVLDIESKTTQQLSTSHLWNSNAIWIDDDRILFSGANEEKDAYQPFEYVVSTQTEKLIQAFGDPDSTRNYKRTFDRSKIVMTLEKSKTNATHIYDPTTKTFTELNPFKPNTKSIFNKNSRGWFKLTNEFSPNKEIFYLKGTTWQKIYSPSHGNIVDMVLGENFIAIEENFEGIETLNIYDIQNHSVTNVPMPETLVSVSNVVVDSDDERLYFDITGYTRPPETRTCALGRCLPTIEFDSQITGFSSDFYEAKRVYVLARDGVQIPVSFVYRKDKFTGKNQPVKLYGYGSYGNTLTPQFSKKEMPLLDRGVIYVVAHIRGGREKGETWYDAGRHFNKMNTFNDFIDVSEHLVQTGLTSTSKLAIEGASAGGLLVGAVINMRPDLFRVAVLGVPFVDVLNTMTLYYDPLAKFEKNEWGDGLIAKDYKFIKSYDPYTNIKKQKYPSLLVFTGFEDTAVYYFQPMKWVAKMRELNPDANANPIAFFTSFKGGHAGESGEDGREKMDARNQSFVLGELGVH